VELMVVLRLRKGKPFRKSGGGAALHAHRLLPLGIVAKLSFPMPQEACDRRSGIMRLPYEAPKVGNDPEADALLARLFDLFATACGAVEDNGRGGKTRPGSDSAMYYVWLAPLGVNLGWRTYLARCRGISGRNLLEVLSRLYDLPLDLSSASALFSNASSNAAKING
jgi:hypothetical protein